VLTAVFRDAHLAGLIIPIALLEIAESWIAAITPLYADAAGTLTASGIGLLFTYAGALGVVLQMPITQATGRMSGFSIVMWSGAVQALAFACLLVSPALPFLVGAVTLLALAQMLSGPGADYHYRACAAQRPGDLSGHIRRGQRSQGRRRPGDRDLALYAFLSLAVGNRHRGFAGRVGRASCRGTQP